MSDHLPESFSLAPILAEQGCTTRKDSETERLAEDNPETNPITIKPETASLYNSCALGFPYPTALHPGVFSQ